MAIKFIRSRASKRVAAFNDSNEREAAQLARVLAHTNNEDVTPSGGGSSALVFEISNLTIPQGTDWSLVESDDDVHIFGEFDVPRGVAVVDSLFIETLGHDTADGELQVAWGADLNLSAGTATGGYWGVNLSELSYDQITGLDAGAPTPPSVSVKVWLSNAGPSESEVIVTYARAAFLLI